MCSNGWKLDIQYYLFHGEYRIIKHIEIDEEYYLEFSLGFRYSNQIVLHISKYHHEKGATFATSNGLGKNKILDETCYKRKSVNKLAELTKDLDNDKLLEINKNTKVSTGYGIIVESEEF